MATTEKQDIYYFHMKVGFGNSFLPLGEQLKGLWVGYAGDFIPAVNSNGVCSHGQEKVDLRYMAVATSDTWRDRVRIVTYAKDSLLIWKPVSSIRYLSREEGEIDWSNPKLYRAFDRHWHLQMKELGGIGSPAFYDLNFGVNGWKVIPAELEEVISRDRLIAPVDSLAVWQHFIRNTFQPIFTLNGSSALGNVGWLKATANLPPMPTTESKELRESMFGKFFRYYMDGLLDPSSENVLIASSETEKTNTILGILNPAQMETAAMLLCQDLGLSVDVGVGKGLDVVDVKATARHMEQSRRTEVVRSMLKNLEVIGVNFSPKLRDMISSSGTLRIQCKASNNNDVDGTVLLLEPSGSGKKNEDRLTLEQVASSDLALPALSDWIGLLRHDLSRF